MCLPTPSVSHDDFFPFRSGSCEWKLRYGSSAVEVIFRDEAGVA